MLKRKPFLKTIKKNCFLKQLPNKALYKFFFLPNFQEINMFNINLK